MFILKLVVLELHDRKDPMSSNNNILHGNEEIIKMLQGAARKVNKEVIAREEKKFVRSMRNMIF